MKAKTFSVMKEGDELVVRVPLEKPKRSASGKTQVVASSHGPFNTGIEFEGFPIIANFNAFFHAADEDFESQDSESNRKRRKGSKHLAN